MPNAAEKSCSFNGKLKTRFRISALNFDPEFGLRISSPKKLLPTGIDFLDSSFWSILKIFCNIYSSEIPFLSFHPQELFLLVSREFSRVFWLRVRIHNVIFGLNKYLKTIRVAKIGCGKGWRVRYSKLYNENAQALVKNSPRSLFSSIFVWWEWWVLFFWNNEKLFLAKRELNRIRKYDYFQNIEIKIFEIETS